MQKYQPQINLVQHRQFGIHGCRVLVVLNVYNNPRHKKEAS